ncbi:hypothetical protein [Macrococcus equipercicus]|uniref:DUF4367 domain-containing protein n=1 Tax=Macrococcus equipercicus TaxID=69967 RepID=A0A9Q9BRE3_9STAP|nr:hypothetical protein [Macrococcus equipercicus]UTH14209.1 hypothetical protein KFV11_02265 [Macrococcus equipercicus]
MKQLVSLLLVLLIAVPWTHHAEAARNIPGQVNLKDKKVITALKSGKMTFRGVKLGDTVKTAQVKWGKPASSYRSVNQYYDYELDYELESDDYYDLAETYFTGQRRQTYPQFKLRYINYNNESIRFSYKDMLKYWGKKADFVYTSADTENYIYGQTILTYDSADGAFYGYQYADQATIKEIKRLYTK